MRTCTSLSIITLLPGSNKRFSGKSICHSFASCLSQPSLAFHQFSTRSDFAPRAQSVLLPVTVHSDFLILNKTDYLSFCLLRIWRFTWCSANRSASFGSDFAHNSVWPWQSHCVPFDPLAWRCFLWPLSVPCAWKLSWFVYQFTMIVHIVCFLDIPEI